MSLSLTLTLISCLLFAVYGSLIAWYHRAWRAIPRFQPERLTKPAATISVLIPARNEEKNIGNCLGSLARQNYPNELFEVIVIDDHSTDGTAALVKAFGELPVRYVSVAEIPGAANINAHKKFAIETGVAMARGELVVTTDADCRFEPDWLRVMAACYEQNAANFIAAPVRIGGVHPGDRPGTLLGIFQALDFITLQGITGAAVSTRIHSMCNGANLAYRREAFYAVDGFRGIDQIPSGDDMLLMHKIAVLDPRRVFFLKSRQSIVSTLPELSWKGFLHQRVRWASKADSYDDKRIFWVLLLVYLVNCLFLALGIAAIGNGWWAFLFFVLLLAKIMVEYPFVSDVARFFGQRRLMVYFPLLQPLHILYTVITGWLGKFGSYRWKDRKITK